MHNLAGTTNDKLAVLQHVHEPPILHVRVRISRSPLLCLQCEIGRSHTAVCFESKLIKLTVSYCMQ